MKIHRFLIASVLAAGFSTATQAATLSFSLTDQQGSDSTITDVMITDIVGGVNMAFLVNDPVNNADIAAVYFDLDGFIFTDLTIAILDPVTDADGPTNNIQGGNIGKIFDVGVAIGELGSGSDFFDDFEFNVLGVGLNVNAFLGETFAVRGQSVGPGAGPGNPGSGSSKQFGEAPDQPDVIPLPATAWMLIAGMGALVARKKRLL